MFATCGLYDFTYLIVVKVCSISQGMVYYYEWSMHAQKNVHFVFVWVECFINFNEILLVDCVIQFFCILVDFLSSGTAHH